MTRPDPQRIFSAIDATWPPARHIHRHPWHLREGKGGGQRVSAATAVSSVIVTDIAEAETEMRAIGQVPLFMIRQGESDLDALLEARGYQIVDPVTICLCAAHELAKDLAPASAIPSWPPLAIQCELWSNAGIGPARIAVMDRVATPKIALLGRSRDAPAGVCFVALDGDVAMLHALEVTPETRKSGVATRILNGAANWALSKGAGWISVNVTSANAPANALYRKLGMRPVAGYHYRRAPEATT
ncbi:MAG: GNAT family N-acetyltransferase [Silicimonas sp.]|nr:GNAT family N-acetyltransferase [Silicimonas sp.]